MTDIKLAIILAALLLGAHHTMERWEQQRNDEIEALLKEATAIVREQAQERGKK